MTRKPLPKAIRRPIPNLRDVSADVVTDEEAPAHVAAPPEAKRPEAEPALAISAVPAANDPLPAGSPMERALTAKRRSLARKIVERHRTLAALGGLAPLPVVNIAGVTAVNLRMVKKLSELYQLPFQRDRARAMIIGLMGGAVPTGLGAATASTLTFVIPGAAFVGLGVSAVTAAAVTRAIGMVFIESFESAVTAG
jgi:uncharacterized protein (DUF697 family)